MSEHISQMIKEALDGDYTSANKSFKNAIAEKVAETLDTHKVIIAAEIYENPQHGYSVKKKGDKYCVVDAKTGEECGDKKFNSKEDAQAYIDNMKEDVDDDETIED